MKRRDYRSTTSGPEAFAEGRRPYTAEQTERGGALAVFNIRQRQATANLPNAMQLAMEKAASRGR